MVEFQRLLSFPHSAMTLAVRNINIQNHVKHLIISLTRGRDGVMAKTKSASVDKQIWE